VPASNLHGALSEQPPGSSGADVLEGRAALDVDVPGGDEVPGPPPDWHADISTPTPAAAAQSATRLVSQVIG
jgi:hypothetical protein